MRSRTLLVRDVAVRNAVTVQPEESITDCARRMHTEHVGCLIVVEQTDGIEIPIGMLTDRDITIEVVAFGLDPRAMTAGDVMSEKPGVVEEDDDILQALTMMREHGARRLPVTGSNGALVGVIAFDNLLQALAELLDGMVGVLKAQQTRELRARP
jgi:predicted transcriptional regulator